MSRPARLPSAFTVFDRLLALRDRLAGLFRGLPPAPRRMRLGVEAMEDRVVPATTVHLGSESTTVTEGVVGFWPYGVVTVNRYGDGLSQPLTVQVQFGGTGADPLAVWGDDYTVAAGDTLSPDASGTASVTFQPNQTQLYMTVSAKADKPIEGTEAFRVNLLGGSGYTAGYPVGSGSGGSGGGWTGTAVDVRITDSPAVVSVGPELQTVGEGTVGNPGGSSHYGVVALGRTGGDVSQSLTARVQVGGTGADPLAAWGGDYTLSLDGTTLTPDADGTVLVTFAAGQPTLQLVVAAKADNVIEETEAFRVSVLAAGSGTDPYQVGYQAGSGGSGGSGGEWVGLAADVRITDVPAIVFVGPESQTVPEGSSGGVWVYRTGGDTTQPLTASVAFGPNGGGDPLAVWDADYLLAGPGDGTSLGAGGGTVAFAADQTAVHLDLDGRADDVVEGTEGFRVTVLDGDPVYLAGWGSSGGSGGWYPPAGDVRIPNTPTGSIGDFVWADNGDGVFQYVEAGSAGMPVTLRGGAGAVLATTITDADGHYSFATLLAGSYTVEFVAPPGHALTTPATHAVSLAAGQAYAAADAGVVLPQSVWVSGATDGEETTDGSAPIQFQISRSGTAAQMASAITVSFGLSGTATPSVDYTPPTSYPVQFAANQTTATVSIAVVDDTLVEEAETLVLTLQTGTYSTYALGTPAAGTAYIAPSDGSGSIGGRVWDDDDADGVQDSGEGGLGGVSVSLLDGSRVAVATTTTASSGLYTFNDLPDGTYQVRVAAGPDQVFTLQDAVSDDALDGDVDEDGESNPITLLGTAVAADAGVYTIPPEVGDSEISGVVWDDTASPDSTSTGDPKLEKVAVDLFRNGVYLKTVYTNNSGAYTFPQLPAGEYQVQVASDPFRQFVPMDVGPEQYDSDVNADGQSAAFSLTGESGSARNHLGAGYRDLLPPTGVADDTVYIINANGGWKFGVGGWTFGDAAELRVAKWEKAFQSDPNIPRLVALTAPDESGADFIDRDKHRFYVLVKNAQGGATENVTLGTEHPSAAVGDEYRDTPTSITLVKCQQAGWGEWYISDSQMLVSNTVDDRHSQRVERNQNAPGLVQPFAGGIGTDNRPPNDTFNEKSVGSKQYLFPVGDRTHIVALGGTVKVLNALKTAEVPVKVKGVVKLHVNNMRNKNQADGGTPAVADAVWHEHLKVMREIYAQVGLDVQFSQLPIRVQGGPGTPDEAWRLPPASAEKSDPPAGAGLNDPQANPTLDVSTTEAVGGKMYSILTDEEKGLLGEQTLRTLSVDSKDDIEVYYVSQFTIKKVAGESFPAGWLRDADQQFAHSVVIAATVGVQMAPNLLTTLAHEVGHVLDDRDNTVIPKVLDPSHYPYTRAPRVAEKVNLMASGAGYVSTAPIFDSRRLTGEQEVRFMTTHPELIYVGG